MKILRIAADVVILSVSGTLYGRHGGGGGKEEEEGKEQQEEKKQKHHHHICRRQIRDQATK